MDSAIICTFNLSQRDAFITLANLEALPEIRQYFGGQYRKQLGTGTSDMHFQFSETTKDLIDLYVPTKRESVDPRLVIWNSLDAPSYITLTHKERQTILEMLNIQGKVYSASWLSKTNIPQVQFNFQQHWYASNVYKCLTTLDQMRAT